MRLVHMDPQSLSDAVGEVIAGHQTITKCPFTFTTPGILTGAALYTPTPGDVLLDLWLDFSTPWNGTTPKLDIGTFDHGTTGIFQQIGVGPISAGAALSANNNLSCVKSGSAPSWRDANNFAVPTTNIGDAIYIVSGAAINMAANAMNLATKLLPAEFVSAAPIKVCVSQTGATNGADPVASQGAGTLFVVTATPALQIS